MQTAISQPRRGAWSTAFPHYPQKDPPYWYTLISNSQPPEPWDHKFLLLKSPFVSLSYVALESKDSSQPFLFSFLHVHSGPLPLFELSSIWQILLSPGMSTGWPLCLECSFPWLFAAPAPLSSISWFSRLLQRVLPDCLPFLTRPNALLVAQSTRFLDCVPFPTYLSLSTRWQIFENRNYVVEICFAFSVSSPPHGNSTPVSLRKTSLSLLSVHEIQITFHSSVQSREYIACEWICASFSWPQSWSEGRLWPAQTTENQCKVSAKTQEWETHPSWNSCTWECWQPLGLYMGWVHQKVRPKQGKVEPWYNKKLILPAFETL